MLAVAFAGVMVERQLTNDFVIQGDWQFQLYEDEPCSIPMTAYDWGFLTRGQSFSSARFYIKFEGIDALYLKWNVTVPHEGITVTHVEINSPFTKNWLENTWCINEATGEPFALNDKIRVELKIDVASDAPSGSGNFVLTFYGSDDGT